MGCDTRQAVTRAGLVLLDSLRNLSEVGLLSPFRDYSPLCCSMADSSHQNDASKKRKREENASGSSGKPTAASSSAAAPVHKKSKHREPEAEPQQPHTEKRQPQLSDVRSPPLSSVAGLIEVLKELRIASVDVLLLHGRAVFCFSHVFALLLLAWIHLVQEFN